MIINSDAKPDLNHFPVSITLEAVVALSMKHSGLVRLEWVVQNTIEFRPVRFFLSLPFRRLQQGRSLVQREASAATRRSDWGGVFNERETCDKHRD